MDLQITSYNNRFRIKGTLNKLSLKTFDAHFSNIFQKLDEVILNIEHIESIDRAGVMALAKLHNESINRSKKLSIIGLGCKELYDHFKSEEETNTASIPSGSIVAA
ncbi:STAS domain-containing protein [Winogradskyella sp. A2]|uniref:STAS domain-containing protein n=1 Tax=Winogradskyella sp. A2 TaxID=3366944 RepID=UPI00398C2D30